MKKNRNRPVYDRQPEQRETLPEYILRMWPESTEQMGTLLRRMTISYGDVADLQNAIDRTNRRSIQLLQRRGRPEHILRTREELVKLLQAQQILRARGIA